MEEKATEVTDEDDPAVQYHLLHTRMKQMVVDLLRKKFGSLNEEDPRPAFLVDLEVGRITARVELTAYAQLLIDLLEVKQTQVLAYINTELGAEVKRLQEELGDNTGTPGSD